MRREALGTALAFAMLLTACGGGGGGGNKKKNPPPSNNPPTLNAITTPQQAIEGQLLNVLVTATDPESDPLSFVAFPLPELFGPEVIVNVRKQRFESLYKEYKVLRDEAYESGPVSGRIFVFERAAGKDEQPGVMKTTEVLWRSGGTCFLLNLIAEKSAHDEHLAKFTALLNSFEPLAAGPKRDAPE